MTNFKQFLFLGVGFNYAEMLKSWVLYENPNWFKAEQVIIERGIGYSHTHKIRGHFLYRVTKYDPRFMNQRHGTQELSRNAMWTRMMEVCVWTEKQFILRRRDWGIYQLINYFLKRISPQNTGFWAYREKKTITVEFVPRVQTFFTIFQRWKAWMEQSPTVIESDPRWHSWVYILLLTWIHIFLHF